MLFLLFKVDMIRVILLLKQMVRSCQNCSHSSIASFFPVSDLQDRISGLYICPHDAAIG